ncbi:T9SS type A sorting domain-containing protein [Flavobacterium sp.]|uniref:T9SS type A sorting domain-containing protein n=1 Tax=Flavobacterium sp. TaxID=239 RepID=UPI0026039A0F|nr:T9SS type A sorting domain-containing protein [Flavobacterium sp.]
MKKQLLILFFGLFSFVLTAQNAGDIDATFPIGNSINANGNTRALAIQSDGKTIAVGSFYDFSGSGSNGIARLNLDGTRDVTFNTGSGFNDVATCLAIQPDGKIVVAGAFTSFDGTAANHIVRLNSNGSVDTSFNSGSGFNNSIYAMAMQSDGKIILGGDFTTYNGASAIRIIRLNTDGTADTNFNSGTGCDATVLALLPQPDGKIILGGLFVSYNGTVVNNIVRIAADGTIEFYGAGCTGGIYSMAFQPDGKLVLVGNFTVFAGFPESHIVRLNSDATIDTSFVTGSAFDGFVRRVAIEPDGKITLGGNFTSYNGITSNGIIRLNADGSNDTSFVTGTGFNAGVLAIAIRFDGKTVVGGLSNFYNGFANSGVLRLNADGTKDVSFNPGLFIANSFVNAVSLQTDGKILVAGEFNSYFGSQSNRIIRLNQADGSKDVTFNTGTGFNGAPYCMVVQSDGKILVGGSFSRCNEITSNGIARLNADGLLDVSFQSGTAFNADIYALAVQSDGKIIAGGAFTTYNGTASKKIIRLNTDGSIDTSFVVGTGFNNDVWSMVIQSDGKVLIGGAFTSYNGVSSTRIIRLNADGTKDNSFVTGLGFNAIINNLLVQPDNKIVVAGKFTLYNGGTFNRIARLNSDGTTDTSFLTGTAFDADVLTLARQTNGKILAGGSFTVYNGTTANHMLRLNADGTNDTSFVTGTGNNDAVRAIAIQSDRKIIAAGQFWSYNSNFSNRIVRLTGDSFLASTAFWKMSFSIYPNPVAELLHLNFAGLNTANAYEMFDVSGKKVASGVFDENQINVSALKQGIYILKIQSENAVWTEKFTKM